MGLLHGLLNPNSCKVWVSFWHKGRALPTHTVTGVAMTAWACVSEEQGCLPVRDAWGANIGAGIGGILKDRQGCSANAAPGPSPALVMVLRSVMPGGGPSLWRPCGKGLVHSGSVYWTG